MTETREPPPLKALDVPPDPPAPVGPNGHAPWVAGPDQPPSAAKAGHINEIDSLRALAMTAVIAQHCKILPFGWMGVWLFFVISGFVVTTSLLSRPSEGAGALLRHFYIRRAARILPIYLGYVALAFVILGLLRGQFAWPALPSLALFYSNFAEAFIPNIYKGLPVDHLWTISVEMQFYLFFGFAFALLPRRALIGVLAILLLASPILRFAGGEWLAHLGVKPLSAAFIVYAFSPMHFDSFAAGALLALGAQQWSRPGRAWGLFAAGVAAIALYAVAYAAINHAHGAGGIRMLRNIISGILIGDQRQVWLYSAIALLASGVLAMTLTGKAPWSSIARSPWLQSIGRVSYGGYVYHIICITWVRQALKLVVHPAAGMAGKLEFGGLTFCLVLPLTIGAAMLSYRYIERPIIVYFARRA